MAHGKAAVGGPHVDLGSAQCLRRDIISRRRSGDMILEHERGGD